MSNFRISLIIFFACLALSSIGQVSISQLSDSGIKSEEDLRKLGVSETEIKNIKREFFENSSPQNNSLDKEKNSLEEPKQPVENETPVTQPIVKDEKEVYLNDSLVYGHSVLQSGYFNLKENSDRIIPSPNYLLGTGDRISVTIWGSSEFSNEYTLDSYGNITPSLVGRINLKGKTFSQAKQIIKSRFSKVYNLGSSKIAINLTFSKVITVNIVGNVNRPGTYSVPSVNSAFNLLSLAKGITDKGSVRNIQIKRNGKTIHTIDLYEFLMAPSQFSTAFLQDGDFIVVNGQQGIVKVSGEFKNPGLFEIKKNESVSSIIKYCGGFSAYANKEAISIIGVKNNKRVFNSFSISDLKKQKLTLSDGDILSVLKISELVYGMVEIEGAVNVPGKYKFTKGMKISDLVNMANGVNRTSLLSQAQLIRLNQDLVETIIQIDLTKALNAQDNPSNLILNEFDILKVLDKMSFNNTDSVRGTGALKNTGYIKFYKGMILNDLILELHGFKKEADKEKIEVERLHFKKNDSSMSYVEIINLTYPNDKYFKLSANDIVNIRKLPQFQYQKTITINGEVKYPGEYSLSGHEDKLSDLIKRAGGLTDWAFLKGAKLNRTENNLGLLLMDLEHTLNKPNSNFDYILKPGDIITIPKNTNIVSISGAIGYKNINQDKNIVNSPLHKNRRAQFYIKKYGGGYDENAKRRNVFVISSNGMVKESVLRGLVKPKIDAGDEIIVQHKKTKNKKEKKGATVDWNQMIENVTLKTTGILTLLILANNAFGN